GVFSGNGYLFWDSVHPTAKGHQLIGDRAFQASTAPEPSTLALLAVGCVSVLGWRRLKRGETRLEGLVVSHVLTSGRGERRRETWSRRRWVTAPPRGRPGAGRAISS